VLKVCSHDCYGELLQDNLLLIYFAGFDTSSRALVHLLYELGLDRRVLKKVRAEQAEVGCRPSFVYYYFITDCQLKISIYITNVHVCYQLSSAGRCTPLAANRLSSPLGASCSYTIQEEMGSHVYC
jgi:cytochrome P450